MEEKKMQDETMENVAGGFPEGEFAPGQLCCPRYGLN